jgi:hypothetical protein
MPSLGISRTKYGPGDKQRAYLVDGTTALYIVVCVVVCSVLLLYSVVNTKESLWDAQHELMDDKTKAERFSHAAAVEILQMTAELEAHLAEEIEWDTQERLYFERVEELEEEMRLKVNRQIANLQKMIMTALQTLPDAHADVVMNALDPVVKQLSKETDDCIGKFGEDMQTLGQM